MKKNKQDWDMPPLHLEPGYSGQGSRKAYPSPAGAQEEIKEVGMSLRNLAMRQINFLMAHGTDSSEPGVKNIQVQGEGEICRLLLIAWWVLSLACPAMADSKPKIAIVIDDFGLTYPKDVPDEDWMKEPYPMTFAVMPRSPRTNAAAAAVKKAGKELMIHFPFDPFLKLDLSTGSVTEGDKAKILALWEDSRRTIPGAMGLNNHQSYKATQNRPLMRWFMEQMKGKGLFFVDSHVSSKSVAYGEAKRAGLRAAENGVFLDGLHEPHARRSKDPKALEEAIRKDKAACERYVSMAAGIARKRGSAVAIGHHYYHGTYECLMEMIPKLQKQGFEFVFASQLVE